MSATIIVLDCHIAGSFSLPIILFLAVLLLLNPCFVVVSLTRCMRVSVGVWCEGRPTPAAPASGYCNSNWVDVTSNWNHCDLVLESCSKFWGPELQAATSFSAGVEPLELSIQNGR
ncbi:hypothetical protein RRG08_037807 [Elysia crispata]|uniref:Uncharacterized protein n=1 Tax=Elysia crispata TaxID=231223 RepID=A0AAE1BCJ4_9GAST|nr:hypothetical protein RRG08_037807 [Elysia crispata]